MKYRVTVQGKAFDVELKEGPEGLSARVGSGELEPVALSPRHGSLAALVTKRGALTVSVDRAVSEENVYEVALPGGRPLRCEVEDERARLARANRTQTAGDAKGPRTIRAVMPGIVVKVLVQPGGEVGEKDALLVVEAMKMQNEIRAGSAGTVSKLHVKPGQSIAAGAPLVELAARSS
jgi:pyruvate carboxylase subunit B